MRDYIANVATTVLGITFLLSGCAKLLDQKGFVTGVLQYRILPVRLGVLYGRILPPVEALCGVALLFGLWAPAFGFLTLFLLMSFLAGVVTNILRDRRIDCFCFGSRQSEPLSWVTVFRLCILLLFAGVVVTGPRRVWLALPALHMLPSVLSGLGVLLLLYMLRAAPVQVRMWKTVAAPLKRTTGGRANLRGLPITPTGTPSS